MFKKFLAGIGIGAAIIGIFSLLAMPEPPDGINIKDLKKEAERGSKKAQYKLALCYYRGEHIEKDEVLAMYYLTLSATQDYSKAQYALGLFFGHKKDSDGNVSEENINYALSWMNLAAENQHTGAKLALEKMKQDSEEFEFTEDDFRSTNYNL